MKRIILIIVALMTAGHLVGAPWHPQDNGTVSADVVYAHEAQGIAVRTAQEQDLKRAQAAVAARDRAYMQNHPVLSPEYRQFLSDLEVFNQWDVSFQVSPMWSDKFDGPSSPWYAKSFYRHYLITNARAIAAYKAETKRNYESASAAWKADSVQETDRKARHLIGGGMDAPTSYDIEAKWLSDHPGKDHWYFMQNVLGGGAAHVCRQYYPTIEIDITVTIFCH